MAEFCAAVLVALSFPLAYMLHCRFRDAMHPCPLSWRESAPIPAFPCQVALLICCWWKAPEIHVESLLRFGASFAAPICGVPELPGERVHGLLGVFEHLIGVEGQVEAVFQTQVLRPCLGLVCLKRHDALLRRNREA